MIYQLLVIALSILFNPQASSEVSPSISVGTEHFIHGNSIELYSLDGWLYRIGDDPEWASPSTPIQGWEPVSLGMFSGEVPIEWDGTGWFKTAIEVDSSLIGKEMGIQGRIYGAMEVYLNGELIGRAGVVGDGFESEKSIGYFDPIYFSFDDQQVHHLAIRYSNHNYKAAWHQAPIGPLLTLGFAEDIETLYRERSAELIQAQYINFIQMGFFIALAMLHLILFWYYPTERANLIYGVMMFAVFIGSYYSTILGDTYLPENFIRYLRGEGLFVTLFSVLNIFFVYDVTKRNINWLPVLFSLLALPLIYLIVTNPAAGRPYFALFLYSSFLIAIGFFARDRIVKKWRNLDIILAVYTLYFVLILPRTIGVAFASPDFDFLWAQNYFVFALAGFLIPIGYSVYLAKDIAVTNRNLEQKLDENEKLTTGKLRAEQDKQQLIQRQKEQLEQKVAARTADLKKSLEELRAAQDQLVQQEKLASLGQLTAGIAHEIKNPLNFVNNFSEVSLELVEEVREEVRRVTDDGGRESEKEKVKSEKEKSPFEGGSERSEQGDDRAIFLGQSKNIETDSSSSNPPLNPLQGGEAGSSNDPSLLLEILDDIEANLRKIHEHGSRADGIVKSMLQHSRGGDGKMEPTPLNPLIKEYVNLAFHGMRASKEPINVDIDLQLDERVGEVPLVAEDFSRVILNLCNNAFDAMREKQGSGYKEPRILGTANSTQQGSGGYEPKLTVRTKSDNGKVIIEIEDNGPGIPEDIQSKILQPFFTTKKGTEGTGLGLSITNDIVKAHGGELSLVSNPQSGTKFRIAFPNN